MMAKRVTYWTCSHCGRHRESEAEANDCERTDKNLEESTKLREEYDRLGEALWELSNADRKELNLLVAEFIKARKGSGT
jgi:hypothetical protein